MYCACVLCVFTMLIVCHAVYVFPFYTLFGYRIPTVVDIYFFCKQKCDKIVYCWRLIVLLSFILCSVPLQEIAQVEIAQVDASSTTSSLDNISATIPLQLNYTQAHDQGMFLVFFRYHKAHNYCP